MPKIYVNRNEKGEPVVKQISLSVYQCEQIEAWMAANPTQAWSPSTFGWVFFDWMCEDINNDVR